MDTFGDSGEGRDAATAGRSLELGVFGDLGSPTEPTTEGEVEPSPMEHWRFN